MTFYHYIKPLLFQLDAEKAHNLALFFLKKNLLPVAKDFWDERLRMEVAGLNFTSPVGMAPGFDKNAEVINALSRLGFGFVEAGTVTPMPQDGNPKPRLFRLEEDEAVVNRMGFNNDGAAKFEQNLSKRNTGDIIVGVNIGKNKTSEDAASDYVFLLEKFYAKSDYITVNISSPNTPGLRALQQEDALNALLATLASKHQALLKKYSKHVPLFLKIAPDITEAESEHIADAVIKHGITGLIVSNTTVGERHTLNSKYANEQGGLSGKPLYSLSTEMLRNIYRLTKGNVPIIGVGGISSAEDAYAKIKAGASLVQLYSALVFQGFGLVKDINQGLLKLLEQDGFKHLSEAVGVEAV